MRGVLASYVFIGNVIGSGYQFDYVFDWTILKYPQIGSSSIPWVSTSQNCWQFLYFPSPNITYVTILVLFQQPAGKLALNPGASAERAERNPGMFLSLASFQLV